MEDRAYEANARRNVLWMVGLYLLACVGFVGLTPLWYAWMAPDVMLLPGLFMMLGAIPFHIAASALADRHGWRVLLYLPAMVLNVLGTSLCEAAYYTHMKIKPPEPELIVGAVVAIGVGLVLILSVALFPSRTRLWCGIGGLVTAALMIVAIVLWVRAGRTPDVVVCAGGFFRLLGLLITVTALFYACEAEEPARWGWMRYLSFASFGLLAVAGAVVLMILACAGSSCDCDCSGGDCCCDCAEGAEERSKAKKTRKRK